MSVKRLHVVLLGDSIFDNGSYVPGEPPLATQLIGTLPEGGEVTLRAADGASTRDVGYQLEGLPTETTHIVVSAGGNDALNASDVLPSTVRTVGEALGRLAKIQASFRTDYEAMMALVLKMEKPTTVCTIYDAIPGLGADAKAALAIFNDVILQSAFRLNLPVIDLRLVCDEPADFSTVSAIEPSSRGAQKIANVIAQVTQIHDFAAPSTIYSRESGH